MRGYIEALEMAYNKFHRTRLSVSFLAGKEPGREAA